jgi:hypothetical protein
MTRTPTAADACLMEWNLRHVPPAVRRRVEGAESEGCKLTVLRRALVEIDHAWPPSHLWPRMDEAAVRFTASEDYVDLVVRLNLGERVTVARPKTDAEREEFELLAGMLLWLALTLD